MSKKKERTRLQGEAWHALKDKLTPCNYYTEENGHVKGIFKDDADNQYIHWLNDQEIEDYNMAIGGRKWGATKSLAEEFEKINCLLAADLPGSGQLQRLRGDAGPR